MNGDEKEEAHRPRPLSAGIWTLFSWLRRSERSSSSESVSSVGSARTAVSFDFLAPGNYNFTNTPIVLTEALNPPTETYKKRLQDRNLRRQRDRNVTLHRKYGLFREHGNGFDGFTLPASRRSLGNSVDWTNRERRATSECLQRRAAYVPGKRRAPLPPAIATSASLPRNYKRKRPAPKPPIKNTLNKVQQVTNPVRMTSNSESEATFVPDNQSLNRSKTPKCDKKVTTLKDTKSRTDKNFLKQIFENRKRNSVVEPTTVRLLPSISELDKQATEIIKNNKLLQKKNNFNPDDFNNFQNTTALYEGNSWFCTLCLRKYNSAVDSCNYCLSHKRHLVKKDSLKMSSPRSSIYTQTNVDIETATSSRSSMEERKVLKEILKEMKDSLPKKNKDIMLKNDLNEIPTLRIGSTVQETYKDFKSQPSSSNRDLHNKSNILSISSLLSEPKKNYDQKNITDQCGAKSSILNNAHQTTVTSELQNKRNVQSFSPKTTTSSQEHSSYAKEEHREKNKLLNKTEINITKVTENKTLNNTNIKNTAQTQKQLQLVSANSNDYKATNSNNLPVLQHTSSNIILGQREDFLKNEIHHDNINNDQNKMSSTSVATNTSVESDETLTKLTELNSLNTPNARSVIVNSVTTVTVHPNNKSTKDSKKILHKNTENNCIKSNTSNQNETKMIEIHLQSPIQTNSSSIKNVKTTDNRKYLETEANLVKLTEPSIDNVKTEYNLDKPLNITSLLNLSYHPNKRIIKENIEGESHTSGYAQKELHSKNIEIDKNDPNINNELPKKVTEPIIITTCSELRSPYIGKNLMEPQSKPTVGIVPPTKKVTAKDVFHEQTARPSTSGCVTNSNNTENKLDHYNRRRHLINQLEQSIAKGDEVAAADAAAKLAKLRLSCSVLSFSSQIIGNQNERNKQHNIQDTKITISKNKLLEQGIPQASIAKTVEHVNVYTEIKKDESVNKLQENKKVSEELTTGLYNKSNVKPQLFTSESSSSTQGLSDDIIPINVWIEDKQAARGPIQLNISKRATVGDLRRQAEDSLGLATQLQRWIVGRTLCSDDACQLVSLAGPYLRAPFYLCVVQPDRTDNPVKNEIITASNNNATSQNGDFYTELMKLEKQSLVPNVEPFECGVCMEECAAGAGVILRECIHTFCRGCLSDVVQHSQEPAVACPATGCAGFLQEREIRTIVTSEEYERWLARGLATAECGTRNAFHCRTRDCTGWAFCDPGVRRFPCPVCKNTNCVQCQAIHEGETCEQYHTKLRQAVTAAETNKEDEGTQALLNSLISRGEALECPECRAIITKKWGCDWVKCSACKTEICWVTKGRRWGPGGRGDTSGGCRCGVDGQRCHPSCGYCH